MKTKTEVKKEVVDFAETIGAIALGIFVSWIRRRRMLRRRGLKKSASRKRVGR